MHKFIINKLGPIDRVEISEQQFMVLIGSQASGKSTIAKAMYFFRTIKNDIFSMIVKKTTNVINSKEMPNNLRKELVYVLRAKFLEIFGSSWAMDKGMYLEYHYDDNIHILVKLNPGDGNATNYVEIVLAPDIVQYLNQLDGILKKYSNTIPEDEINIISEDLKNFFKDALDTVYIPAGRNMITLLATQLNYIYITMDDEQKRSIDLCTRNYLENIIRKRPEFESGLLGLERNNPMKARKNATKLNQATHLIQKILKGSYIYNNGDERLEINPTRYVKINFASSGQQEVVWILNLLYYHLLNGKPTFFIIEEPESHLFPESQKYICELISLVNGSGHKVLLTTHSPYVLGSINNLLYAGQFVGDPKMVEIEKIIDRQLWINSQSFDAWFLSDGNAQNCVDSELGMIQNELIDEISGVINRDYDDMLNIKLAYETETGVE